MFPDGSGVNVGVNASGLDVLGNRFIAASDGRLKEDKRPISLEEGLAFVTNVPAMLYQKHGVGGRDYEAGFIAQDMINAGLVQTIVVAQDPDMPAERFGSVGPAGTRYEMQTGAAVVAGSMSTPLDQQHDPGDREPRGPPARSALRATIHHIKFGKT